MATIEYEPPITIRNIYTFDEAIEFMKQRDKWGTTKPPIKWVYAKTGKPVAIGYSS